MPKTQAKFKSIIYVMAMMIQFNLNFEVISNLINILYSSILLLPNSYDTFYLKFHIIIGQFDLAKDRLPNQNGEVRKSLILLKDVEKYAKNVNIHFHSNHSQSSFSLMILHKFIVLFV